MGPTPTVLLLDQALDGTRKGSEIDGHGIGAVSHMDPEDWARAQGNNYSEMGSSTNIF